jgi:CheY-like chemotaxis protein
VLPKLDRARQPSVFAVGRRELPQDYPTRRSEEDVDVRTILLVEDNPDDELLTRRALRRIETVPHDVAVVRDGVAALEYLHGSGESGEAPAKLPDLVLLDLKMPKLSGLEVLQRLRSHERTRDLPVVVFTSSSEERDLRSSYDMGANAYVRKPVDFAEFCEAVARLGQFWLVTNEPPQRS